MPDKSKQPKGAKQEPQKKPATGKTLIEGQAVTAKEGQTVVASGQAPVETPAGEEKVVKKVKRSKRLRQVPEGCVYIQASYNNTIITFTDPRGDVIAWSSAGASGFRGTRKATPYAAQVAAENASSKAQPYGFMRAHIYIKGIGSGREQSVRALIAGGIEILSITDVTPIAHNGCRPKKPRFV